MSLPGLSIIIPCLNEVQIVCELIDSLWKQENIELEIIVVDGGSEDDTRDEVAKKMVTCIEAKGGRGCAMNAGARIARYGLLLFLHADSKITDRYLLVNAVEALAKEDYHCAGHFSMKFFRNNMDSTPYYFYYEEKTKLNRVDTFGGDQGLLIDKRFFDQLGQFDESLHFLEDKKIGHKILQNGNFITLPGFLVTSARRFEQEGFARRMILNAMIMVLFRISYQSFFDHAHHVYRKQKENENFE